MSKKRKLLRNLCIFAIGYCALEYALYYFHIFDGEFSFRHCLPAMIAGMIGAFFL